MTVTIQIKISAKAIDLVEDMEIIIFPPKENTKSHKQTQRV